MIEKPKFKVGDLVNGSIFKWVRGLPIVEVKEYKLYDVDRHVRSVWHYQVGYGWYTESMLNRVE